MGHKNWCEYCERSYDISNGGCNHITEEFDDEVILSTPIRNTSHLCHEDHIDACIDCRKCQVEITQYKERLYKLEENSNKTIDQLQRKLNDTEDKIIWANSLLREAVEIIDSYAPGFTIWLEAAQKTLGED